MTLVEEIEQRYPAFPGINLTHEVLAGQRRRIDKSAEGMTPMLEVQVVDLADSITYDAHDVDDAVELGWLELSELLELPILNDCYQQVTNRFGNIGGSVLRRALVHELIDLQVSDFLLVANEKLSHSDGQSASEVCDGGLRLQHSPQVDGERGELEAFLFDAVYRHSRLIPVRQAAATRLRDLFHVMLDNPARLPLRFRQRAERLPLKKVIGEYLASHPPPRERLEHLRSRFDPGG